MRNRYDEVVQAVYTANEYAVKYIGESVHLENEIISELNGSRSMLFSTIVVAETALYRTNLGQP